MALRAGGQQGEEAGGGIQKPPLIDAAGAELLGLEVTADGGGAAPEDATHLGGGQKLFAPKLSWEHGHGVS
jgi:hypothetical protein